MFDSGINFGPTSCAPDEIKMLNLKIYCVVAYCTPENKHRCFGYYKTLTEAREALLYKWKILEECYYDSFFIEMVEEGLFAISKITEYYEIGDEESKLLKKEVPSHLTSVVNWSIG